MVLRLALLLVERKFFEVVEFSFLVVGHTKNPCDRMFNILKQHYRHSNIYTYEQLMASLNSNERTTVRRINEFQNWDSYLDTLYYRFSSGTVHKAHVFRVKVDPENEMEIMVSCRAADQQFTISREFKRNTPDRAAVLIQQPTTLGQPGIPLIKQIELAEKWRPHVPVADQDTICPVVSEKEKEKYKQGRKRKREAIAAASKTEETEEEEQTEETQEDNLPVDAEFTNNHNQAHQMLMNMQYSMQYNPMYFTGRWL